MKKIPKANKTETTYLRLDPGMKAWFQDEAIERGVSASNLMRMALKAFQNEMEARKTSPGFASKQS